MARRVLSVDGWQIVLLAAVAVLAWQLVNIILIAFGAVLIAVILRGLSDFLADLLHLPIRLTLVLTTIISICLVIAVSYWIVPTVLGQFSDVGTRVTEQIQVLRSHFGNSQIGHAVISGITKPGNFGGKVTSATLTLATTAASEIGWMVAGGIASLYLAGESEMYLDGSLRLLPPHMRPIARDVAMEVTHTLRRWLLGQLVDMFTVGGLAALGLYLLGIPAPFALAVFAGLLTIIPYFGALMAGIPGVLVALTQSFSAVLWVIVIFTACHLIEGYVVAPLVQRRMVRMPPAVIILALAVFATLFGPLGIILGAPLGVTGLVLIKRLYVDRMPDTSGPSTALP